MDAEQKAKMFLLFAEIEAVRNLRPKTFGLVTDAEADIKARWTAFDEIYEAIRQGLREKKLSPDDILTTLPDPSGLTPDQLEANRRKAVALNCFLAGADLKTDEVNEAMIQADKLVPTAPDPDTGRPPLTMADQALLNRLTNRMRTEAPDDWASFYKNDTAPVEVRKAAFGRMYRIIGPAWMEGSLFPHRLTEHQRQWWVIFAFMCHVPGDQWGPEDTARLERELLPVEELD